MRKKICSVFAIAFLLSVSCESQRPLIVPEAQPEDETVVIGWMSLSDGTFHPDDEALTPEGYYVRGRRKSWEMFHPTSDVLGKRESIPKAVKKQPAWIELDDGSIHPVEEGVVPRPPYVRGYLDPEGKFYPDPQEIMQ